MKKILLLTLTLCLLFGAAARGEGPRMAITREEVRTALWAEYSAWTQVEEEWYGSGGAQHARFTLMLVEENQLLGKELHVILSPLRPGDPIPWEVTDLAPIPLSEGTAAKLMGMPLSELNSRWSLTLSLTPEAAVGCADFLLNEGERWEQLVPYPDFLAGVVEGADGQRCLRIAHWDGMAYVKVTQTGWAEGLILDDYHSWNEELIVSAGMLTFSTECGEDGVWRLSLFGLEDDSHLIITPAGTMIDYSVTYDMENNDMFFYGALPVPTTLDGFEFSAFPRSYDEAIAQLDATGWACVKQQDACLYDAPGGHLLATCYLRLPGRVIAEEGDWVQLQIGSEKEGMTGWFRREALAFGDEVNRVVCSFPAMADNWYFDSDDVDERFPGLTARLWDEDEPIAPWELHIWLVGRTVDGGWLVLVEEDYICTVPAEVIGETGPTSHLWDW